MRLPCSDFALDNLDEDDIPLAQYVCMGTLT